MRRNCGCWSGRKGYRPVLGSEARIAPVVAACRLGGAGPGASTTSGGPCRRGRRRGGWSPSSTVLPPPRPAWTVAILALLARRPPSAGRGRAEPAGSSLERLRGLVARSSGGWARQPRSWLGRASRLQSQKSRVVGTAATRCTTRQELQLTAHATGMPLAQSRPVRGGRLRQALAGAAGLFRPRASEPTAPQRLPIPPLRPCTYRPACCTHH